MNEQDISFSEAEKDEEVLVKSLDNPKMFEILVDRYQEVFLRTSQRILRKREDAEDAVQDTFVKIYFNAKKFEKREGVEFKSWAFRVLLNCTFSRYRKMKRVFGDASYEDKMLYVAEESVDSAFESREIKDEIQSVLTTMPEELSALIKEHYLDDKPYTEIAAGRGMTINALKMKLFRARASFKDKLEKTRQ